MIQPPRFLSRWISIVLALFLPVGAIAASPVPSAKPAAYPAWWFERDVIKRTASQTSPVWPTDYPVRDDYVVLNQGQLKNLAVKAYAEMQARLPAAVWSTPAGTVLTSTVSWTPGLSGSDDFAAVNQGQIKNLAKKFYNVLKEAHYVSQTNPYPWTTATTDDDNYSLVVLGQAKKLFSFDLTAAEGELPAWWKEYYFGTGTTVEPWGDEDHDWIYNIDEYEAGTSPTDYYNGDAVLTVVLGQNQTGLPGTILPVAPVIRVTDSLGNPKSYAPITFTVQSGSASLVRVPSLLATPCTSVTVETDYDGYVTNSFEELYFKLSSAGGGVSRITVNAGLAASAQFVVTSTGTVAQWKFNEASGTTVEDEAGNNDGVLRNAPTRVTGLGGGKAIQLNGTSQDIQVTENPVEALNLGASSFTVSAWFKTTVGTGRILSKGYRSWSTGYYLGMGPAGAGTVGFGVGSGTTGTGTLVSTNATFHDGYWHHAAGVVDRTNNTLSIYVDGIKQAVTKYAGSAGTLNGSDLNIAGLTTLNASSSENLVMGSNNNASSYFAGAIDDVSVTARVLTPAEITALSDQYPERWAVAEWKLDETSGTLAVDSAGGNNGTLRNSPSHVDSFKNGKAVQFNGTNQDILVTESSPGVLNMGTSNFSVSAWFKTTSTGEIRLLTKGHFWWSTGYLFNLGANRPGSVTFGVGATEGWDSTGTLLCTNATFHDGLWHHAVGVFDRTGNKMQIYVDGVKQPVAKYGNSGGTVTSSGDELDISSATNLLASSPDAFTMGSYLGTEAFLNGALDDVRVIRKALTPAEIISLYRVDTDTDGLPDIWEHRQFGDLSHGAGEDPDQDGATNVQEYGANSDPQDYYNGVAPTLEIVSGNLQTGDQGSYSDPLVVRVKVGGVPVFNAPVKLAVTSGGGKLTTANTSGATELTEINLKTDMNGLATLFSGSPVSTYYRQPNSRSTASQVTATAGTALPVVFSFSTLNYHLVGRWAFNEGTGITAADQTSAAHQGTLTNGASWGLGVESTGSLHTDGVNDYVTVGSPVNGSLDFGLNSFSISLWAKYTATGSQRLVTKGQQSWDSGYYVGVSPTGGIEAGIGTTVTGTSMEGALIGTTATFNDGQWHHIAVTFDRELSRIKIQVDNVLQPVVINGSAGGTVVGTNALDISGLTHLSATNSGKGLTFAGYNSAGFFAGDLDDVRLYQGVLDASQIDTLSQFTNDGDGDGLPNDWENEHFGSALEGDASADPDGDHLSNLREYQLGSDPNNYFSQGGDIIKPRIFIFSGGKEQVPPGEYSVAPLVFKVVNSATNEKLVNAPVTVDIPQGEGSLAQSRGGPTQPSFVIPSDVDGLVKVYFKAP